MKKNYILLFLIIINYGAFAQSVPAYVDTNGLIGWYPFTGNANNAYGASLNGYVSGPALTTDRFGNPNSAYHFNGMADHIVIDTSFFNVGWGNFTISWWMYNDSIDNPSNYNNNQASFNTIPAHGLEVAYNWGHNNKYQILAGSNPITLGWNILGGPLSHTDVTAHIWNHLAIVKHNTTYQFYLNGLLDTTYITSISASNYYCMLIFGNIDSTSGTEGMRGKLDDYGIWRRALSGCEIKKLFSTDAFTFLTSQPDSVLGTISATSVAHFSIADTGTGNTYQWQVNTGTGFSNITGAPPYTGVTTPTLTVTGLTGAMNGHLYRCVVIGLLGCTDTSDIGRLATAPLLVNNINNSVSISPNPTTGTISITDAAPVDIKIYNALGQLIKQAKNAAQISISDMPTGTYLIKLFNAEGALIYYNHIVKL